MTNFVCITQSSSVCHADDKICHDVTNSYFPQSLYCMMLQCLSISTQTLSARPQRLSATHRLRAAHKVFVYNTCNVCLQPRQTVYPLHCTVCYMLYCALHAAYCTVYCNTALCIAVYSMQYAVYSIQPTGLAGGVRVSGHM